MLSDWFLSSVMAGEQSSVIYRFLPQRLQKGWLSVELWFYFPMSLARLWNTFTSIHSCSFVLLWHVMLDNSLRYHPVSPLCNCVHAYRKKYWQNLYLYAAGRVEGNVIVEVFIAASVDPVKSSLHTSFSYPSAFPSEHAEAGAHRCWLNTFLRNH